MAARRAASPKPKRPGLTVEQKRFYIDRLKRRIDELEDFNPETVRKRFSSPEVMALQTAIEDTLSAIFGNDTPEYFRYITAARLDRAPVTMGGDDDYKAPQYLADGKQQSLALLRQAVWTLEEEIAEQQLLATPASIVSAQRIHERKIFIVHGHDEGAREAVARFVQKIGFEPIILHEQANQGKTVIEKVEAHSDVSFAVVLLTPDDEGSVKGGPPQPRARQNVLLELGYFMGRLGRKHVCVLKRGNLEIPSDFGGVVYEVFDAPGGWKQALGRELEAAGYSIDWNEVMRS